MRVVIAISLLFIWLSEAFAADERGPGHGNHQIHEVVFEPTKGRFFRFVATSENSGRDGEISVADFQLLGAADGGPVNREAWQIRDYSGRGLPAVAAIDESLESVWVSKVEPPHYLEFDLGGVVNMSGFRYLPGKNFGAAQDYAVYVSADGSAWGDPIMRGQLVPRADGADEATSAGAPAPIALVKQEFTPEGMVYGPVAIDVDTRNRVYVAETYRYNGRGVIDNRGKKRREEDDLKTNRLNDRRANQDAWLADGELGLQDADFFTKYSEKVSLFEDVDGDGYADRRKVVADEFNNVLDGAAAGVLVRGDDLYFANIPSIWKLSDTNDDDVSDRRQELSRGYGVRTGWYGHDLHGLTWGPDGRLYFSIADRGFDVKSQEGKVFHGPNTGAVFRCWADGSQLELVAQGLRNPQELAFDELGYLFTGDNNCDAGDRARLVYVVEGGDSGWRVSVQSLADRGPWKSEAMWEMPREEEALQPAWMLPPVAHINSGPSGLAHYPGVGLPEAFGDYFFLCDYRGGRGSLQAFRVEMAGASFVMRGHHTFHDGPAVSDVCFGYDGRIYLSEWGPGWGISPEAKIYTLAHTASQETEVVGEVQSWFHRGLDRFSSSRLAELLSHRDQRVRYEAQRLLVDREEVDTFERVLARSTVRLARLHAVWGVGQLARKNPVSIQVLIPHLKDPDPEVLSRLIRVGAEHGLQEAGDTALEALGAVNHPRLRFHAAYAVGRLRPEGALESLIQFVNSNHDLDLYLRHAAVMGLVALQEDDSLLGQALASQSEALRLATVLVLRRRDDSRVVEFLSDASASVATEAARAIYDREISRGMTSLASALVADQMIPEPFLRRALHANFQLGKEPEAERLCQFALAENQPIEFRAKALDLLLNWDTPPNREGVWGRWRPFVRASGNLAKLPVRSHLQKLLELDNPELQMLAQRLDALYGAEKTPRELAALVMNDSAVESLRVEALLALESSQEAQRELYEETCPKAMAVSHSAVLRAAAVLSWARVKGDEAALIVRSVIREGKTALEKQGAVRATTALDAATQREFIREWMVALEAGKLDPEIQLDVFESAETSKEPALAEKAKDYREKVGMAGIQKLSLYGGSVEAGRIIYETNLAAQCMRCHALLGKGGDVGPALDGVARRRKPEELLRSVVDPQADIAPGYGVQTVTLKSGDYVAGTVVSEDEVSVTICENGQLRLLSRNDIAERSQVVSGMPPAGLVLQPRELRDLLAFLQSLE